MDIIAIKRIYMTVLFTVLTIGMLPLSVYAQKSNQEPKDHEIYKCIAQNCSGSSESDKKKVEEMKTNNPRCSGCHGLQVDDSNDNGYRQTPRSPFPRGSVSSPTPGVDSVSSPFPRGSVIYPTPGVQH